jgi:hypothetical protein
VSILVTLFGIVTLVNTKQFQNAREPILVMFEGARKITLEMSCDANAPPAWVSPIAPTSVTGRYGLLVLGRWKRGICTMPLVTDPRCTRYSVLLLIRANERPGVPVAQTGRISVPLQATQLLPSTPSTLAVGAVVVVQLPKAVCAFGSMTTGRVVVPPQLVRVHVPASTPVAMQVGAVVCAQL